MQKSFETQGPLRVDVSVPAGLVEIEAVPGGEAHVQVDADPEVLERTTIELDGDALRVRVRERNGIFGGLERGSVQARLRVPESSAVSVSTKSADLRTSGWLENVRMQTASGDTTADRQRSLSVKSASGDVAAVEVLDDLSVQTASGDVRVARVGGKLSVQGVSGDVHVQEADGEARVSAVSGDVELECVAGALVKVDAVSGDVQVGVRRGSLVHVDASTLSGDTRSELELDDAPASSEDGPAVELRIRTVSGDISVVRAATTTAP